MPTYTFHCDPAFGGCSEEFEVDCMMCDYSPSQKCPNCLQIKSVVRIFEPLTVFVEARTMGMRAIKNSEKLSEAEKAATHEKNNAYRHDDSTLPTGKESMRGRDSKIKISNKQYATDPRKKKKRNE